MNSSRETAQGGGDAAKLTPYLSIPAAIALSVGFAVGWGAFIMPGLSFLPKAGPVGTVIGIAIGAMAMFVFALNYHRLSLRAHGPGGAYTFAQATFGYDHGFVAGWFMFLAYISILWANETAIKLLLRYIFGNALQFGFHYQLAGFDVYFGEVLAAVSLLAVIAFICLYCKKLAAWINLAMVATFLGIIGLLFFTALGRHQGGIEALGPAFSPGSGHPISQILGVVAMMPWAFVGFEAITHSEAEFKFPTKRTFAILSLAVVLSALAYAFLALLPVVAVPSGYGNWSEYLADLPNKSGPESLPVFFASVKTFGRAGIALVAVAMLTGMATGIVGALVSVSRLMYAMSHDNILPRWFGRLDSSGSPRNGILFITAVSAVIPFFGRTVIGWPVDVASIGIAIAFGYTSLAAVKTYGDGGRCKIFAGKALGVLGVIMAVFFGALLLIPNFFSATTLRAESYLVLALWSIFGFIHFRREYSLARNKFIGRSSIVWTTMFLAIIFTTLMWSRQKSMDTIRASAVIIDSAPAQSNVVNEQVARIDRELLGNSLVEMLLLGSTLFIILKLFGVMRRREVRAVAEKIKAEELNKAKSYFFSTVSHDIRTPLNAIIGFSEMLKDGFKTEEERTQAVDSILVSGKTLLNLINDVLDLSKLESGKMQIAPEPTDCKKLLGEISESFLFSAKNPNVDIRAAVAEMPTLMLDPQRIRQIAFNLMGNAVKFTESGFVEVRASFSCKPGATAGTFRMSVEDTGCGITEEDMKHIAKPYMQLGTSSSRHGGTGLGLAICRQLAKAMGGELTLKSTVGKGSTFTITIPNVQVAAGKVDAAAPEAAPAAASPIPKQAKSRRILLVDDQKLNLMVLKSMLQRISNFDLTLAGDGSEAINILMDSNCPSFDMVLTDLWMPKMNGEELVRAIRGVPRLKKLPVYVITADVETRKSYAETGFTGYLLKPVTIESLKTLLT